MHPPDRSIQSHDCMHAFPHPSACQADPLRRTNIKRLASPPYRLASASSSFTRSRFSILTSVISRSRRNFLSILNSAKYIHFQLFDQSITMAFFNDAWKAMDGFGQEAGKQIGGAADEVGKNFDQFGQEAGRQIGHVTNEAGEKIGTAAKETYEHVEAFGQDAAEQIRPALEEAWKDADAFGQEAGKQIGIAAEHTKQWIEEHPGETAGIIACVLAAPLGIAAAHGALHMVGFTAAGVAAGKFPRMPTRNHMLYSCLTCLIGSTAAGAQAGIGSVAAGSTFAVLQSAAAGGAGAILVNGIAAGTATGLAVAATAPRLIGAMKEGKKEVIIDDVTYKIEDKGNDGPSPPGQ